MRDLEPRRLPQLLAAVPHDLAEALVDADVVAGAVHVPDADPRVFKRPAKARLALAERLFGLFSLRDILNGAVHADRPTVLIVDRPSARMHEANGAVMAQQPQGTIIGRVVAQRLIHRAPDPGKVIGVNDADAALEGHRTPLALQAEDAVVLFGPDEQVGGQIPVPAADAGES